ncbi:hypothetical protein IFM89_005143 [Coptis chinensis]|uniref:DNA/RNA-binding protein Alba-like domain-containing protein n=1 Tax=Coptis chinensis TaxID=261450 RepID=A0A835IL05_9MAGN|nr:hypothetical protein IFM89_005143 [Coptis chinensis]
MEVITNAGEVIMKSDDNDIVNGRESSVNGHKKNRIQVSNTKKPLFFYVNLAKKYMRLHEEVELSALGMAIATVVTIAEILKNNGLAIEKKILTSTVGMKDENKGKLIQKAKIEIWLSKSENFESLQAAAAASSVLSKTAEDNVVSKMAEDGLVSKTAEDNTVAKISEDNNMVAKMAEDMVVLKIAEDKVEDNKAQDL